MTPEKRPYSPLSPDEIAWLNEWARKNKCHVEFEGECGIMRECVGITTGSLYPDTDASLDEVPPPEDAYHKHDCLAVLGRGPKAERQLYEWVCNLDDAGYGVVITSRRATDMIDLLFHGSTSAALAKGSGR